MYVITDNARERTDTLRGMKIPPSPQSSSPDVADGEAGLAGISAGLPSGTLGPSWAPWVRVATCSRLQTPGPLVSSDLRRWGKGACHVS